MLKGFVLLVMAGGLMGQAGDSAKKPDAKPQIVPISREVHHHLVLENDYVRVFHVVVPPHAETKYHQHDMDYVFVTLGDSVVENDRVGESPAKLELKDGQTVFVKGGFAHKAVNLSDKPFVNVTVELKTSNPSDTTLSCNVCSKEWRQTKPPASIKRVILRETSSVRVVRWDFDGAFKVPPEIDMRQHLFVSLEEFLLERGVTNPESKVFQVGDVVWNPAGKYFWRPEIGASFVTIEMAAKPKEN